MRQKTPTPKQIRKHIHNTLGDDTPFTDVCGILQSSLLLLGMGVFCWIHDTLKLQIEA